MYLTFSVSMNFCRNGGLERLFSHGSIACGLCESNFCMCVVGGGAAFGTNDSYVFPQHVLAIVLFTVGVIVFWCPEPALDVGHGLLFIHWFPLSYQGQCLLPSFWSRSPDGQV